MSDYWEQLHCRSAAIRKWLLEALRSVWALDRKGVGVESVMARSELVQIHVDGRGSV